MLTLYSAARASQPMVKSREAKYSGRTEGRFWEENGAAATGGVRTTTPANEIDSQRAT